MGLLQFISNAFINTMGITKPSPRTERRAAWFIVTLLVAVLVGVATVAYLALHFATRH
jgi:ABC-type amino acid transport system permease subunit